MNNEFYTILTNAGLAAIANASVSNATLNFSKVAVGDGNGAYYTPTRDMTALRRQTWEGNIASVQVAEDNPNWINVEAVIPATDGGFYIREIGIFNDANVLLAIGKLPETYKPEMESGSTKDLYLRAIFEVTNASVITLKVDPSVVLASKQYVDDKVAVVSTNLTSLSEEFTQHKEDDAIHVTQADKDKWNASDNAKFKSGSSTFTDNDTSQTFIDAFCTANSLVTVVITSETNPQGVWSVDGANGSFTITSTVAESADITFDYFVQKAVG